MKQRLSVFVVAIVQAVLILFSGVIISLLMCFIVWGFGADFTHNFIFVWMWVTLCSWTFLSVILLLMRTLGDLVLLFIGSVPPFFLRLLIQTPCLDL